MPQIKSKHIGAVLGLLVAWLLHQYGFFVTLTFVVMTALGWVLGRAVDGEVDLWEFFRSRDRLE